VWHTYRIVNRFTNSTIYVGISADLKTRLQGHEAKGPVADFLSMHRMESSDLECVIEQSFESRQQAAALERQLIVELPGLLNATKTAGGRPRIEERHLTYEARKPWAEAGMSRATWYRRQKELRGA
jgi:predicted GIY-YIG superfamily endonuclease